MTSIAVLADIHLTSSRDTVQYFCWSWALEFLKKTKPDLIVLAGDVTAVGTVETARMIRDDIEKTGLPFLITLGNAEIRTPEASSEVADIFATPNHFANNECLVLTLDTSTGVISESERNSLNISISDANGLNVALATHMAIPTLEQESREWLEGFLAKANVSLFVCAHRHREEERVEGRAKYVMIRGLDPEKAISEPPAIALFKLENEIWNKEDIVYTEATACDWNALERQDFMDRLGVSFLVEGEIFSDMDFAISERIPCIELRNCAANLDRKLLLAKLQLWREAGGRYLSWHMPNLVWNPEKKCLDGVDSWRSSCEAIEELGVQGATVHPPYVPVGEMEKGSATRESIAEASAELLSFAKDKGIAIALENLHMEAHEKTDIFRRFGYLPDELIGWRDEISAKMQYKIGFLLDLGHARNNGPYSSTHTLGEWFSAFGQNIGAFHIHQVAPAEKGGNKTNHAPIQSLFGPLISYGAFLCAWKRKQISHCPIFIEVRGQSNRQQTYLNIKQYIQTAKRD